MALSVNGEATGTSVAAADITDAGAAGVALVQAATAAAAQTTLRGATTYNGSSSSGWTLTNGDGTAAVTGGVFRLTMPPSTGGGDGGRASIVRDHTADVPADAFRARVRIAALTNGSANTFVGFYLFSSTTTNEARFGYLIDGGAAFAYVGGSSSGTIGSAPASTIAFDGTWWMEIVVRGLHVALRVGQGTSSTPPAESSTTWRWVYSGDLHSRWNGGRPWDRIGLFLTQYDTAGGAITVDFDDLILERLA